MYSTEIARLNKKSKALIEKWNSKYSQEISVYFQEQMNILESIRNNIKHFEDSQKKTVKKSSVDFFARQYHEFHVYNLNQLKTLYTKLSTRNEAKEFTTNIESGLLADIKSLTLRLVDEYNAGPGKNDSGIRSNQFLERTGNFFYFLRCVPVKTRNWVARLFKKAEKPVKPRRHDIYYKFIAEGYLLNQYVAELQRCTFEIQKKTILYAHNLFESETKLINSNYQVEDDLPLQEKLPDINEELKKIEKFYSGYENTFISLLEKSGTWELPLFYIRYKQNRNSKQTHKMVDSTFRLWDSTFYAFYEDWRFRENLFSFISTLKILASRTISTYSEKLDKTISPIIASKREYIEGLINRIPNPDVENPSALKHFFNSELYKLHKETRNQSIIEDLQKTNSEIEKVINKLEVDATKALEELPEKSGVVRSPDYEKGIHKSDIYFFSPAEFIGFECIPPFLKRYNSINADYSSNFNEIVLELSDFDHITDFTLDTAISLVNAHSSQEQIVLMFKEGLIRSLNILDRVAELSNEIINNKGNELTQAFSDLYENIKKLDSNDSIVSIYSRLLKSKALEESKDKRKKIKKFILLSGTSLLSLQKKLAEFTLKNFKEIRKKLKLDKATKTVSSEISNYLADINRRIFQLPIVYRYLFENAPVKEQNLFLSRQPEIDKLNSALKAWKVDNYFAATLIISENGSGKSSLLQNYIKTIKGSFKIKYFSVIRFYTSENDFYKLMQDIFENNELDSDQKILELLNTTEKQTIVMIDGLERVFLRKPGGFDCLHKLLSLIVSTNDHALWICAVSQYSCNYLNKTVSLKENFDYLIELNHLSSEEVKGIILKRHRLSGFFIKYEDELKENTQNKKKKIQQFQLEADFFNELNKFAEGNISLALYYWLESISKFTEKELYIKQFQPPDVSFLETLSADKLYALLLIVFHGKLSVENHALICNQSTVKSSRVLTILKEDSIVLLKGDYYILNGILYRHVIQLLKNKNLIH